MAADKKKSKKSKTLGKKDLKQTKGGLLPAVMPTLTDKTSPSFTINASEWIGK